jgi:hypothetical protein
MNRRGPEPRDEEFLRRLTELEEDRMMIYPIPDPEARIKGLYQHPLQKVVRNQGRHQNKKFHCWKWIEHIYVVRLRVPNAEAMKIPIPPHGAQSEPNLSRTNDDGVGPHSSETRNVRTPGSGGGDSS